MGHPLTKQQKNVFKAQLAPIRKKLNKCHHPDRWNLVELQRARREQALKKANSEDGDPDDRGGSLADDGTVFGETGAGHLAKKRKVVKGLDDPFGGPFG